MLQIHMLIKKLQQAWLIWDNKLSHVTQHDMVIKSSRPSFNQSSVSLKPTEVKELPMSLEWLMNFDENIWKGSC